eukprot:scaffold1115_cov390-Prasinococcus_capsulatus_cf.AAC.1
MDDPRQARHGSRMSFSGRAHRIHRPLTARSLTAPPMYATVHHPSILIRGAAACMSGGPVPHGRCINRAKSANRRPAPETATSPGPAAQPMRHGLHGKDAHRITPPRARARVSFCEDTYPLLSRCFPVFFPFMARLLKTHANLGERIGMEVRKEGPHAPIGQKRQRRAGARVRVSLRICGVDVVP